ncbi:unnamed protein product [Zymoseptoria tritici ST99CH_1A5]|uniref:Uncharacterized protein n=1 Tax=Zymoseptoria tritici ST99CH_1A5 TaxID=1276529 RepID=A0A1Y6M141_ZYMTR|nr:unnamed protein product [Zymoseptoria tritici ST99CH_3D1]SMY30367.1 unnamed protein product [Zymoseptoria tritici ST99CH_1A5]
MALVRFEAASHSFMILMAPPGVSQTDPIFNPCKAQEPPHPLTTIRISDNDLPTLQAAMSGDHSGIGFGRDNGYVRICSDKHQVPIIETRCDAPRNFLLILIAAVKRHLNLGVRESWEFGMNLLAAVFDLCEKMEHKTAAAEDSCLGREFTEEEIFTTLDARIRSYGDFKTLLREAADVLHDPDPCGFTMFWHGHHKCKEERHLGGQPSSVEDTR